MGKLLEIAQLYINRRKRLSYTVKEFMHTNKDLLFIIADPKTDEIYIGYDDRHAKGEMLIDGKKVGIVKKMLKTSKFEENYGAYVSTLASLIFDKTVSRWSRIFLNQMNNMIFNLNKSLRNIKSK